MYVTSCVEEIRAVQKSNKEGRQGSFNRLAGATVTDFPVTSESGINVSH